MSTITAQRHLLGSSSSLFRRYGNLERSCPLWTGISPQASPFLPRRTVSAGGPFLAPSARVAPSSLRCFSVAPGKKGNHDDLHGGKPGGCPVHGRNLSHGVAAADSLNHDDVARSGGHPELKVVPSLPLFGSFFGAVPLIGEYLSKRNNVPVMKPGNTYDFTIDMRRRYGDFYAWDIPGVGTGSRGTCYVLNDPNEMIKVVRQEGSYPRGAVEMLYPFRTWMRSRGMAAAGSGDDYGFFGRGETWRRLRTFIQTDLLSPQSAREYVPGVAEAASIASRGAPAHASTMNAYFNFAAFDMFNTVFFGQFTRTSNPDSPTSPEDAEFCRVAVDSLSLMVAQIADKTQRPLHNLGIETEKYRRYVKAQDAVNRIARDKVTRFSERYKAGELDEFERASYLARAFDRLGADGSNVTEEEFKDICVFLLNVSVDTTSAFMCWMAVHLAANPGKQEILREEIRRNMEESGGELTAEILSKKRAPYMHASLRESHRMTPVLPTTLTKSNLAGPIVIHGREFPKNSVFRFDQFSLGMDPAVVDNPEEYRPERWLPEELKAAKGTPMDVLDHPFFRDPFSQGARRCPGSRVAVNETLAFLAKLIYDWRIEFPNDVKTYKDVEYRQQAVLVPQLPEIRIMPAN